MIIAATSAAAIAVTENEVAVVAIISTFVLFPIAIAYARLIWRRGTNPPERPAVPNDVTQRLTQMQQSIDAMAVEIERISEGQRFVTKLLSEQPRDRLTS